MDEKDEIVIQAGVRKKTPDTGKIADLDVESTTKKATEQPHKSQGVSKDEAVFDVVENNLDDVPSMSVMQKVIIALAAVGIIAFVTYYLLVLR